MTNAMTPARYVESLFGLDGKLAVVTGASRGIGLAISQALASAGADIVGVSREMPQGDSNVRTVVEAQGRKYTPLRSDFSVRVVVGVYKQPTALDRQAVCFKEQTILGVGVYTPQDVTWAIELIASGALGLDRFPTKSFDLKDVAAAFDATTSGQDCLKVLLTPLSGKVDA